MSSIDTNTWITQKAMANLMGVPVQNVHNWVQRKKIETLQLPGSNTVLVNKDTLTVTNVRGRKPKILSN
jgi:hypothetical protein